MIHVHYVLSEEYWKEFEDDGFLAIPVWGGYVLTRPGYEPILVDPESPELTNITDTEFDGLVSKLALAPF